MNRLAREASPYLLQHADQPVHWEPWDDEAFARARDEDKPIFLSIGYATCHWCHVMAQESFAHDDVAELLNRHFVSVKVDREERPDVDDVYMNACRLMTGSGGWPLTIIMDAGGRPFFSATYLPRESRYGRLGLLDVLRKVVRLWQGQDGGRDALTHVQENVVLHLHQQAHAGSGAGLGTDEKALERATRRFRERFDSTWGGFGSAPKFPTPQNLFFLLDQARSTGSADAEEMVDLTLRAMCAGGIFDHIGGGFARYSTDSYWLVPHFEKMLYDNALLMRLLAEYIAAYPEAHWARWALRHSVRWLLQDMSAEGCFASAQDADSSGREGLYYLWTPDELKEVLGTADGTWFAERYGIDKGGHMEGGSIPNLIGQQLESAPDARTRTVFARLREVRAQRHPLLTDDKILLGWNALAVSALVCAGAVLEEEVWVDKALAVRRKLDEYLLADSRHPAFRHGRADGASQAAPTLREQAQGAPRHLLRYKRGQADYPAGATDLALLAECDLMLYRHTGDGQHLLQAVAIVDELEGHYADGRGGFFETADDAERLIQRPRTMADGAMMGANSTMVAVYDELFSLLGAARFGQARDELVALFSREASSEPLAHGYFLRALNRIVYDPGTIRILHKGTGFPEDFCALAAKDPAYFWRRVVLDDAVNHDLLAALSMSDMASPAEETRYIFCQNGVCHPAVGTPEELPLV